MKKRILLLLCVLVGCMSTITAQEKFSTVIEPLKGERWWGGFVALGDQMPFGTNLQLYDMTKWNFNNQVVPFVLSSNGRYVWSDQPFSFELKEGKLILTSIHEKLEPILAGTTLKDAFLTAATKHFPSTGTIPEELFFSMPQYNTWIELMYDQNQKDIMNYAHKVVENGFPKGVFMIDDNWQKYYGNFDYKPECFSDPKGMTDELHRMGFKVMLWVAPFVSADSPEFREFEAKGFLLKNKGGGTAIVRWWNGFSAAYDTTNPEAMEYLKKQLRDHQAKYGTDGFKFDGGDISILTGNYDYYDKKATKNIYMEKWAALALDFPYNELRASWKLGGQPLVQRLGDKDYSWNAVGLLVPDMLAAGLLGYYYTCPDMIGGGSFTPFINLKKFDEELIVRSCQIHALMPMMQFSVAPWRILSKENAAICAKFAHLHQQMGNYILSLAHHASKTGEPIVRYMEYEFPHQGFIDCKDQFMLGSKYLVAPMTKPGNSRQVKLPKGTWKDDLGKVFKGPREMTIDVPLDRLPYFEKMK